MYIYRRFTDWLFYTMDHALRSYKDLFYIAELC